MFGFIIKKIRESRNFSQEYMAAHLNITQAAYSKLESDKTHLSIKKLLEICKLLGIKETDILNGDKKITHLTGLNSQSDAPAHNDDYISSLKKLIDVYEKENEHLKSTNERLLHIIEQGKTGV